MKKIAIMVALVAAAATSFGAMSISWDVFGFKSGSDNSLSASLDNCSRIVWDLVYTTSTSVATPSYNPEKKDDTASYGLDYGSDTLLSRRVWESGESMSVSDFASPSGGTPVTSSSLGWNTEYSCIAGGTTMYQNFNDTTTSGGIYAAVFQYMNDETVYWDYTEINDSILWTRTAADPNYDSVNFPGIDEEQDYIISKTLYEGEGPAPEVPEPATMSLLGLGALAMVLRRKLSK